MIKISVLDHLTASEQPEVLGNYSTYLKEGPDATRRMIRFSEVLEDASPSTRRLQDSATKSSGACQTWGGRTAHQDGIFYSRK